jgi:hypothetical protein
MGSAQVDPFGDPENPGSCCRPGLSPHPDPPSIRHEMPFLDPTFAPPLVENCTEVLLDFPEDRFLPVFRC